MDVLDAVLAALSVLASPGHVLALFGGVLLGLVVGILPGLGGTAGLALLLPFLFGMEPSIALAMMIGLQSVTVTSDTFPSVPMGIPGASGSQATVLDGFPMPKNGEAARALSAAFVSSMFGGVFGAAVWRHRAGVGEQRQGGRRAGADAPVRHSGVRRHGHPAGGLRPHRHPAGHGDDHRRPRSRVRDHLVRRPRQHPGRRPVLHAEPWIARLTTVRYALLAPFMFGVIFFAAFQSTRAWGDLIALLILSVLGVYMKRFGWPRPALLIGFVLADQVEEAAVPGGGAADATERGAAMALAVRPARD